MSLVDSTMCLRCLRRPEAEHGPFTLPKRLKNRMFMIIVICETAKPPVSTRCFLQGFLKTLLSFCPVLQACRETTTSSNRKQQTSMFQSWRSVVIFYILHRCQIERIGVGFQASLLALPVCHRAEMRHHPGSHPSNMHPSMAR